MDTINLVMCIDAERNRRNHPHLLSFEIKLGSSPYLFSSARLFGSTISDTWIGQKYVNDFLSVSTLQKARDISIVTYSQTAQTNAFRVGVLDSLQGNINIWQMCLFPAWLRFLRTVSGPKRLRRVIVNHTLILQGTEVRLVGKRHRRRHKSL